MPKSRIPDALEMKTLKYGATQPPAARDKVAAALRAAGRRTEAILLFEGRADDPSLSDDRAWAIAEGSSFMLASLRRIGVAISNEDLRACAVNAESKGRWYDAFRCYERLADEAALARVKEHLPNFKVAIPENKKD